LAEKRIFADEARIFVQGGRGGDGAVSLRHEKYAPRGGPDGGNGGRGGDVLIVANSSVRTLSDLLHRVHIKAQSGRHGEGNTRDGRSAADRTIKVPVGTVIRDADSGELLADLARPGQGCLVAKGGKGGRGNAEFATATERTPRFAEKGEPGQQRWLKLELKLLADVGLIGMPNAGKSTFLSRVSAARPKIADYPFTTLEPQLGVVKIDETDFVLADLPGLIEGAHEGVGLGDRFLGHAERCATILHLVDGTGDAVAKTYKTIRKELIAYGHGLGEKPEVLALNKVDAIPEKELAKKKAALEKSSGQPVHVISGVTGAGINTVLRAMAREIAQRRLHRAEERQYARPAPVPRTRAERQSVNYQAPVVPKARMTAAEPAAKPAARKVAAPPTKGAAKTPRKMDMAKAKARKATKKTVKAKATGGKAKAKPKSGSKTAKRAGKTPRR
jgi:GTP-binding protein